jgi:lactoylglutathione lyase
MTKLWHVVLFVSNMDRSVAFYQDVLGWPLKCQSPERTEFATQETTLALLCASKPSGAAAVQGHLAGRCQLGLWVDDIETFHQNMVARGTFCIQPPTEAFGAKLAVYADPDGLPFSVAGTVLRSES